MNAQPLTLPKEPPVRDAAFASIRALQGELALLGVTDVWMFGSVARGDDTPASDVDIALRTVDPSDILIDADARDLLTHAFGRKADVTIMPLEGALKDLVGDDLVHVF